MYVYIYIYIYIYMYTHIHIYICQASPLRKAPRFTLARWGWLAGGPGPGHQWLAGRLVAAGYSDIRRAPKSRPPTPMGGSGRGG